MEKWETLMNEWEESNKKESGKKVYKSGALWVATYLGGPLAAGCIFIANYETFGQPGNVRRAWLVTIIATIIIFAGAFLIPWDLPDILFPLIYTVIAALIFHCLQEEQIQSHIESGGKIHGWGRVIVVSLIGLVVTLIAIAIIYVVIGLISSS